MAAVAQVESYGFMTEWHDPQADIMRHYTLTLFVQPPGSSQPNEVQMFDVKQKRTFLRRTPLATLALSDLIVGGTVTIFSRLLKITGYMDGRTREILTSKRQTLTVTLNAAGFRSAGDMLSGVSGAGLTLAKLRLIDAGGPTMVCEVVGDDAQAKLEEACAAQPWFKYAQVEVLAVSFSFLFICSSGFRPDARIKRGPRRSQEEEEEEEEEEAVCGDEADEAGDDSFLLLRKKTQAHDARSWRSFLTRCESRGQTRSACD
jgi:hypothetical protein